MKNMGLAILIVGVGLAASFGARLSPEMNDTMKVAGKASVTAAAVKETKGAYCAARKKAELPVADGCPDPEADKKKAEEKPKEKAEEPPAEKKEPTREELVAAGMATVQGLKASSEALPQDLKTLREAYVAAEEAAVEPGVDAKLAPTPPPAARVSSWFKQSGLPFGAGLLLVIIGAVIARKAVHAEASGENDADGEAVDFGKLLSELTIDMRALADSMGEKPEMGQFDRVKERLEAFQFEAFQPIVEARVRIQVRFGLASFAELFGPFSSAERRANRAWSALVDQHWPEARESLKISAAQLEETMSILDRLLAA